MKYLKRIFENCELGKFDDGHISIIVSGQIVGHFDIELDLESFWGKIWRYQEALLEHGFDYNIEDGVELAYLYIDENLRKKGYAQDAIHKLIDYLKSTSKSFIILEASDVKTPKSTLLRLYKKCGFIHMPTENGDYMIYQLK
jgi:GNAT superfamily N-acetyltransferase